MLTVSAGTSSAGKLRVNKLQNLWLRVGYLLNFFNFCTVRIVHSSPKWWPWHIAVRVVRVPFITVRELALVSLREKLLYTGNSQTNEKKWMNDMFWYSPNKATCGQATLVIHLFIGAQFTVNLVRCNPVRSKFRSSVLGLRLPATLGDAPCVQA
jgi:hypothetical protein